jgi:hypothetical protein
VIRNSPWKERKEGHSKKKAKTYLQTPETKSVKASQRNSKILVKLESLRRGVQGNRTRSAAGYMSTVLKHSGIKSSLRILYILKKLLRT